MDHQSLIDELPEIEKLPSTDRIVLARERRAQQIQKCLEREAQLEQNSLTTAEGRKRPKAVKICPELALLDAAIRGDHQEVEHLLMEGIDPNSHNCDGLTALHQCAIDNNEQILRLLIDNGADVNAKDSENWTPLHAAACCGYIEIVRLLIDHAKRKLHEFNLEMASKNGEICALKTLLKEADANAGGINIISKLETRIHDLETALANQLTLAGE